MPNTTAVRNAKDMMAASTLSLVCSSITASFAGSLQPNDARLPPRHRANLLGCSTVDQPISMLRCNNSMVKSIVSIAPHWMMHKNNGEMGLIQEPLFVAPGVFTNY